MLCRRRRVSEIRDARDGVEEASVSNVSSFVSYLTLSRRGLTLKIEPRAMRERRESRPAILMLSSPSSSWADELWRRQRGDLGGRGDASGTGGGAGWVCETEGVAMGDDGLNIWPVGGDMLSESGFSPLFGITDQRV